MLSIPNSYSYNLVFTFVNTYLNELFEYFVKFVALNTYCYVPICLNIFPWQIYKHNLNSIPLSVIVFIIKK